MNYQQQNKQTHQKLNKKTTQNNKQRGITNFVEGRGRYIIGDTSTDVRLTWSLFFSCRYSNSNQ